MNPHAKLFLIENEFERGKGQLGNGLFILSLSITNISPMLGNTVYGYVLAEQKYLGTVKIPVKHQ